MSVQNLWGSLPEVGELATPLGILRQQAALLGDMAHNLLEAKVVTRNGPMGGMIAELDIVAPPLGGYRVSILGIQHELELYPVTVKNELTFESQKAQNEKEFVAALKNILQSAKVRRVIELLLVQIKAAE